GEDTLLRLPGGDRQGDLLVIVGHCPTEVAIVCLKDVARVVGADLAEPLVVLSLGFVHRCRPSVLAPFATRRGANDISCGSASSERRATVRSRPRPPRAIHELRETPPIWQRRTFDE